MCGSCCQLWVLCISISLLSVALILQKEQGTPNSREQETDKQCSLVDKMTSEQQIHKLLPLFWKCEIYGGYIVVLPGLMTIRQMKFLKAQILKFWNSSAHRSIWLFASFNQGTISSQPYTGKFWQIWPKFYPPIACNIWKS